MMKRHEWGEMLVYALKDNQLVFVDDVENGDKCGCVCPACASPLSAKNHGTERAHHFAHKKNQICEYACETALHLLAKDILSQSQGQKMTIPPVKVNFPNSGKKPILLSDAKEILIDKVELETRFESVIPDVVIYSGDKKFFVEIFVTHKIDNTKLAKLKKQNISTVEVNLSKRGYVSREELTRILLEDSREKTWRYNAYAKKQLDKFYSSADKLTVKEGYEVDCPLGIHYERNYVSVFTDCKNCRYCIDRTDTTIFCSGRLRISCLEDFDRKSQEPPSKVERVNFSAGKSVKLTHFKRHYSTLEGRKMPVNIIAKNQEQEDELIFAGRCPKCGGHLQWRSVKSGDFYICSKCIFSISSDYMNEVKRRIERKD